jgi:hypothetical protein
MEAKPKELRYKALFKSGALELENESDDPQELKNWIANLLARHPSPDYALIRDEELETEIFNERNR